jgi:hypothetical protein
LGQLVLKEKIAPCGFVWDKAQRLHLCMLQQFNSEAEYSFLSEMPAENQTGLCRDWRSDSEPIKQGLEG